MHPSAQKGGGGRLRRTHLPPATTQYQTHKKSQVRDDQHGSAKPFQGAQGIFKAATLERFGTPRDPEREATATRHGASNCSIIANTTN
jgi:hypothetical protein